MFHNISNPKWFGNWSRLEDDYLGNGGTDIAEAQAQASPNRRIRNPSPMPSLGRRGILGQPSPDT